MELKTNDYQAPSLIEIRLAGVYILCASLSGSQLGNLTEEDDDNLWSDIY